MDSDKIIRFLCLVEDGLIKFMYLITCWVPRNKHTENALKEVYLKLTKKGN